MMRLSEKREKQPSSMKTFLIINVAMSPLSSVIFYFARESTVAKQWGGKTFGQDAFVTTVSVAT